MHAFKTHPKNQPYFLRQICLSRSTLLIDSLIIKNFIWELNTWWIEFDKVNLLKLIFGMNFWNEFFLNEFDGMNLLKWIWWNDFDGINLTKWIWWNGFGKMNLLVWIWWNEFDKVNLMKWIWWNKFDKTNLMKWV